MKKKFLSSLLFAALIGGAVSTFTACKDYDDDISNLRSLIDKNTAAIEALQAKIDAGEVVTKVESTTNGIKVTTNKGTYDILNGKDGANGVDGKDADVWTINSDGFWCKNGTATEYKAVGKDGTNGSNGNDGKDGGFYRPNATTGCFDYVTYDEKGEEVAKPTNIKFTAEVENAMSAAWADDVLTITNAAGGETIEINLKSKLKALVFEPDFYYEGIEALDFLTIKYTEQDPKDVDANGDFGTDAPTAKEAVTMSPDLAATYHLNPTNAKMVEKADAYSFIAYNKAYTRSKSEDVSKSFNVYKATVKDGYVTVNAKYNGDVVKSISKDKEVTVLALQYKDAEQKDALITSDYAAIRADVHQNLVLNNPKYNPQHINGADTELASHLFKTAAEAIADNEDKAMIPVVWNSEGIDLREWVNTHYNAIGKGGVVEEEENNCIAWDENATKGEVEKAGFKYTFELVGYKDGENGTKQSVHAAIAEDGYTLRPQMPKADGNQAAYGAEQNKAEIGRMPLVRVILWDMNDKDNAKAAAVGYIKVKITETEEDPTAFTLTLDSEKDYTLKCEGDVEVIKTTWNEIEHKILAQLNMSKEAFEAAYVLDENQLEDANQFAENTVKATKVAQDKKIGIASQTTKDIDGHMTEVISWNVQSNKAYQIFKDENTTSVSTYIRYTLKDGQDGPYKYFYVELKWTPKNVNIKPSTEFGNDVRIKQYWYADNSYNNIAKDEIHGNVGVPGVAACAPFNVDIKNTLVGNMLKVSDLQEPYKHLQADLGFGTYFVGGTYGVNTKLVPSVDGTKLYADEARTQLVATIDPSTGIISYADNNVAKEMLNEYDHEALANEVTARVAVKANVCLVGNIEVKNNEFDVVFLRPIDITGASCELEDATDNGSTADLKMTFKDWREKTFLKTPNNYYTHYGVKDIKLDIPNATTNLNGGSAKLADVAPLIKLTYSGTDANKIAAENFGTITYKNNGTTVGEFDVTIPAKVEYTWGIVKVDVKCHIKKTVANSIKK